IQSRRREGDEALITVLQDRMSLLEAKRDQAEAAVDLMQSMRGIERQESLRATQRATELAKVEREARTVGRQYDRALTLQRQAEERPATFTPTADLEKTDPLKQVLKDARSGRPKEPERLWQFLRRQGGIQDQGGELAFMGVTAKSHPLLVRKTVMPLDEA